MALTRAPAFGTNRIAFHKRLLRRSTRFGPSAELRGAELTASQRPTTGKKPVVFLRKPIGRRSYGG